ncbi:MAG TPA: Fic family protein [bacterium]|nr:Fic family protein [bacterium]
MKRGLIGRYEISITGGEKVSAFVPVALPPAPPIDLSPDRQRKLEEALMALGRLDSVSTLLPDPLLFLYAYVRREAVLSSQIEGTQSSLSDFLLFESAGTPGVPLDDVVEVSNYVAALDHGMTRLQKGFPLSNRLIREMHALLLRKGRGSEKMPGQFRRTQNWIGGTRPGNARFVPPPPAVVEDCMAAWERYLHDDGQSALIKAALAHLQFETIHPFLDGNGRIGRLFIALLLHHERLLAQPLLYLSLFFKRHRQEYYRLLDAVRTEGDWEAWIDFFLDGVTQTAGDAVATAQRLTTLFREDTERLQGSGRSAATVLKVHTAMKERPVLNLAEAARRSGLTFPSVTKGMTALMQAGIVREMTGKKRGRIFVYDRYLSILNEETEPLER